MQLVQPSRKKTLKESYVAEVVQGQTPSRRRGGTHGLTRSQKMETGRSRALLQLGHLLRWKGCDHNSWIG
eukprot:2120237-Pleurochrysis_carterae.AAC.1